MLSSIALRHLAACSISLPTGFAASPKLAKETVYMPSALAARVLGTAKADSEGAASGKIGRQPSDARASSALG